MHPGIGLTINHAPLNFFDEHTDITHAIERRRAIEISTRYDRYQDDAQTGMSLAQQSGDVASLPQRQGAVARGETEWRHFPVFRSVSMRRNRMP